MKRKVTFDRDTSTTWAVECSACDKKRGGIIYLLILGGLGLELCAACAAELRAAVASVTFPAEC